MQAQKIWIKTVEKAKGGINRRTRMSILCRRELGLNRHPTLTEINDMIAKIKIGAVIDDVSSAEIEDAYSSGTQVRPGDFLGH